MAHQRASLRVRRRGQPHWERPSPATSPSPLPALRSAAEDAKDGREPPSSRMQDAGCRMQDAGCRMQDAGCRMQDAGCRVRDAGCRMQRNQSVPSAHAAAGNHGATRAWARAWACQALAPLGPARASARGCRAGGRGAPPAALPGRGATPPESPREPPSLQLGAPGVLRGPPGGGAKPQ